MNFTPGETFGRSSYRTRMPWASSDVASCICGRKDAGVLAGGDEMDVGRGDLTWPAQPELVEGLLGDGRDRPGHPDAVGAHGDDDLLAVLVEHFEIKRLGVLAAELEDMADLDAPLDGQRPAAVRVRGPPRAPRRPRWCRPG